MDEKILQKIAEAKTIFIGGHIRPDGDCYGSEVALKDIILSNYPDKEVYITGSGLPNFFDFLGATEDFDESKLLKDALTIIVDLNELYRVEDQRIVTLNKNYVLFDHHIIQEEFSFPRLVDENASSTAEIISKFVIRNNLKISPIGANALYLGILSDSGAFRFANEYPELFTICSYLCKKGADPKRINQIMTRSTEHLLRVRGYVYSHFETYKDEIIYLFLTNEEIEKLGIDSSYGSMFVSMIGNTVGYSIWATFLENGDNLICEFRSNALHVHHTAIAHGGGGHKHAAGVTLRDYHRGDHMKILEELYLLTKGDK